jgi:hypothetical protein
VKNSRRQMICRNRRRTWFRERLLRGLPKGIQYDLFSDWIEPQDDFSLPRGVLIEIMNQPVNSKDDV